MCKISDLQIEVIELYESGYSKSSIAEHLSILIETVTSICTNYDNQFENYFEIEN